MSQPETVFVSLTPGGEAVALRLAAALGGQMHGWRPSGPVDAEVTEVAPHLRALFAGGHPLVVVASAGIVVRSLAPLLGDKWAEPAVVAVAEDGSSAVPLLGGHHGANELALRVAEALCGRAALTTAGDVALGVALDAPPEGWRLENPPDAKAATAALLAGRAVVLSGDAPFLAPLEGRVERRASDGPVVLSAEGAPPLIYRKQRFVLGVGCARGCAPEEMIGLAGRMLAEAGRSAFEVLAVASIDLKSDEAAVQAVAAHLGVPAWFYPAEVLEAEAGRLATPSDVVFAEVGCHGVCEGAALAAAGPGGRLDMAKVKTAEATVALAEVDEVRPGASRGHLAVVGIGPGAADWRTPEASRLIAEADELVGYGLYIDLLGPLAAGKPRADFPLGGEEDRCRYALERAGEGRRVALICSGDAGIYAMGALVMELLDRSPDAGGVSAAARRVGVVNAPGVSALQAASARIGALLGHDFCTISLSDLLTPREDILMRLRAAAEGDFVVAFYNPVSKRRRTLLAEAREILLQKRGVETPVLLASNLGRTEERLVARTLGTLEVDEVDMLTVVLVGSSQSRAFTSGDLGAGAGGVRMYTPRGYARKMKGEVA
ncbi:MAG: precorrin-3B C(17)-methyltransferase [Pseudomonadota bacterium]